MCGSATQQRQSLSGGGGESLVASRPTNGEGARSLRVRERKTLVDWKAGGLRGTSGEGEAGASASPWGALVAGAMGGAFDLREGRENESQPMVFLSPLNAGLGTLDWEQNRLRHFANR